MRVVNLSGIVDVDWICVCGVLEVWKIRIGVEKIVFIKFIFGF